MDGCPRGRAAATCPGQIARLRELVEMGVNHLQVRFMARSAEEYCEQTARFGVEVGPLLNR